MLTTDVAVALLGNTLATLGALYVLISILSSVSGAHFNPLVTLAFFLLREMAAGEAAAYALMQTLGGIAGTLLAHGMFGLPVARFDGKDRDSNGELGGEAVATFGLLLTIFGSLSVGAKRDIPLLVALYITAGYWFTSSTAFANPAVAIGERITLTIGD